MEGGKQIVSRVVKSGLQRANQSKDQIKDAMDSTFLYLLPKVEKKNEFSFFDGKYLNSFRFIGNDIRFNPIFAAVSKADPPSKAELFALGISKAMNTTALGLLCAITLMVLHSFLIGKQNKIVSDVEHATLSLVDLLGTKKKKPP